MDCRCLFPARDYEASSPGPDLSDEQLQDVAKTLGQEWEQAAIHLGLKNEDLDEIKKENKEFMQRRNMLRLWKDRRPGKARAQDPLRMRKHKMLQRRKCRKPKGKTTAQDLLRGLEDLDLPVETRRLLTGNVLHPHTGVGRGVV